MSKETIFKHLETVHATGDKSVLNRQREILEMCSEREWSTQELADYFGMNYFTIRSNMKELEAMGILEVSPRKNGRQMLYRTTWDIVKQKEDAELTVHHKDLNEYMNYSYMLGGFLANKEVIAERFSEIAECLIAYKIDLMREKEGKIAYGPDYRRALQGRAASHLPKLLALVDIAEQFVVSQVWGDEDGDQMFNLPVERDAAEDFHQKFYVEFVNEGLMRE